MWRARKRCFTEKIRLCIYKWLRCLPLFYFRVENIVFNEGGDIMKLYNGYTEDDLVFYAQYILNREFEMGLGKCTKEVCRMIREEASEALKKKREEEEKN